jgi:hypothetical protein
MKKVFHFSGKSDLVVVDVADLESGYKFYFNLKKQGHVFYQSARVKLRIEAEILVCRTIPDKKPLSQSKFLNLLNLAEPFGPKKT